MTQSSLDIASSGNIAAMITLSWGEPSSTVRYIGWTSDLVIGPEVFVSEPLLDISLPDKGIGTRDKDGKLVMPALRSPFDRILTGYRHAPVMLKIEQIDPLNVSTRRVLHIGPLGQSTKNPSGRRGLVSASILGMKSRLQELKVGFSMTTTCQVPFGGTHCRVDSSVWSKSGTVESIGTPGRNSITLTLPTVSVPGAELLDTRFRSGIMDIAGNRLRIKKSYGNRTFDLDVIPPPWSVGQVVTVYAGCDKTLNTCKSVWFNDINFLGLGIKTPDRNPVFEEG